MAEIILNYSALQITMFLLAVCMLVFSGGVLVGWLIWGRNTVISEELKRKMETER